MTSTMDLADAYGNQRMTDGHHDVTEDHPHTIKARAALEQRIKELEADAARMEHLCNSVRCMGAYVGGNHTWAFLFGKGWTTGASFREAIDRAMSEAALDKMREMAQELGLP